MKLLNDDVYVESLITIGLLVFLSIAIWIGSPAITWNGYAPFAQAEKRIYIIATLFLIWLLKFLLFDLDIPNASQYKEPELRKLLDNLQGRFQGAIQFLKKTTVAKQGKLVTLENLPWYLLLGPANAGKTSLLAQSGVNFILQRQREQMQHHEHSLHCDWWITREVSIIDVPSRYLFFKTQQKPSLRLAVWIFFLRLIKYQRGKNGIQGLLLALPFPEVLKLNDTKKYQSFLQDLFHSLQELQKLFPAPLPCHIIVTKCDLLPGFNEFFAESTEDEITQAWGIKLAATDSIEKTRDQLLTRFNVLIKKINQQLIWRLHQERNPMARPYIKDFPLQIEHIKECLLDFMKKLSQANVSINIQSVHLTSALQPKIEEEENTVLEEPINTTQKSMQLFKEPLPATRAYFVKDFINQGIVPKQTAAAIYTAESNWKTRSLYAASISAISITIILLGRDFAQGVKQTYVMQNYLNEYEIALQKFQDPHAHLLKVLDLMDKLQAAKKAAVPHLDIAHILSFYSNKSQEKTNQLYEQALKSVLLPEVRNYLNDYLKNPVNKNADTVYGVLASYLMLNDANHFNADYIVSVFRDVLPQNMAKTATNHLTAHLSAALATSFPPLAVDINVIEQTRRYLASIPSLQLGYIILKNFDLNNLESDINLGTRANAHAVFTTQEVINQIPIMFTAKMFVPVTSQQIPAAAHEALNGNWVLGSQMGIAQSPEISAALIEQLRTTYINNYVDIWESLLANIHLSNAKTLQETNSMIKELISSDSPLLQLLQTIYDNTYFEPITSASPKLLTLGALLDKRNQSDNLLYHIFTTLHYLHQYLQGVLTSEDEEKSAYEAITILSKNSNTPSVFTQLRLIADKSPEPLKIWLEKIANDAWHLLLKDANHYLDTSWQEKVMPIYQAEIANRYPFNPSAKKEIDLDKFIAFFGNPGIVVNFYNQYLQPLIDTSTPEWHSKSINNEKVLLSNETVRQVQHALRIHQTFFPNNDNKPLIRFALQPYQFDKNIQEVTFNIDNKLVIDDKSSGYQSHAISWPSDNKPRLTNVQLKLANQQIINRNFPGDWGWFKLISQSFDSTVAPKKMLINLSLNEHTAKYLLITEGSQNPFLSVNLRHFYLPEQLTEA